MKRIVPDAPSAAVLPERPAAASAERCDVRIGRALRSASVGPSETLWDRDPAAPAHFRMRSAASGDENRFENAAARRFVYL